RWSFYNNSQLSQISLVNVKTIGDWAFAYCDRISNISIPSSVNYIGMNTFRYCHNLKRILIKSLHVVPFGANAFYSIHPQKTFFVHKSILNKYRLSALYANFSIDSAELPPISKQ
ncbi:MAG: leucine-rich repeat protein, partial [Fibrobacter sp.]|nr:leucine-rich repeat protein [Fibrobacter sp.]